jgi:hypothetical protein
MLTDLAAALFALPAIKARIAKIAQSRKPKPAPAASIPQALTWHPGRRAFA